MAMTAQQKTRVTWVAVVSAVAAAATIGTFVLNGSRGLARATASEVVAPVADRVTRLETQREGDKEQLEKMDKKLDAIMGRLGAPRPE